MKKNKTKSKYQKSLLIYFIILLSLGIIFLTYVTFCLYTYEKNTNPEEKIIAELKTSAKKGKLSKYFKLNKVNSDYETKSSLSNGYKELLNSKKIEAKLINRDMNAYDIYADNNLIFTVSFNKGDKKTVLGILTYNEYELKEVIAYNENGLYKLDIYANQGDKVYINDKLVSDTDLLESGPINGYSEVSEYTGVPKVNHYQIKNLTMKPKVKVVDQNNQEKVVSYEVINNKEKITDTYGTDRDIKVNTYSYSANDYYKTNDFEEAKTKLKVDIDPLEFARNYSLFMTDDLSGAYHGFNNLKPYIIKDTELYNRLYKWGSGIDITFMAEHFFAKDKFTNESLSNITIYNEYAFSVEVNTQLNFNVNNIAHDYKENKHHALYYYLYVDDGYKLVSWDQLA